MLYQKWVSDKKIKAVKGQYSSCVAYVKAVTGFSQVIGYAKNWPINSTTPQVGSVVVTTESRPGTNTGHVAIITKIEDGLLYLKEANYIPNQLSTRTLNINSPVIKGYYYEF